jgi:hypothetical protein
MPVIGTPAFNAVAILKIEPILFNTNDVVLVAQGAFVNTDNGSTYGSTTCRRWSKPTLDKLAELRALMEEDLASLVFQRHAPTANAGAAQADPGGIGEELRGPSDAAQV